MSGLIALAVALAAALYLCWLMLQPFINVLLWASVRAVVFEMVREAHRPGTETLAEPTVLEEQSALRDVS